MLNVLNTEPIFSVPCKRNWCTKRTDCTKHAENDHPRAPKADQCTKRKVCQIDQMYKISLGIMSSTKHQGLKYLKMSTTHRGTMEGSKAPSEARRRKAPECRGGRVWGGAP